MEAHGNFLPLRQENARERVRTHGPYGRENPRKKCMKGSEEVHIK
jgi:hypothetical protein